MQVIIPASMDYCSICDCMLSSTFWPSFRPGVPLESQNQEKILCHVSLADRIYGLLQEAWNRKCTVAHAKEQKMPTVRRNSASNQFNIELPSVSSVIQTAAALASLLITATRSRNAANTASSYLLLNMNNQQIQPHDGCRGPESYSGNDEFCAEAVTTVCLPFFCCNTDSMRNTWRNGSK